MQPNEYIDKLKFAYKIICERQEMQKEIYNQNGITDDVRYESVDLSDILVEELVPLFLPILNYYDWNAIDLSFDSWCLYREVWSKVFIATLCEIAKDGFPAGGILKQLRVYLNNEFNTNRYYAVLKTALECEGIEVRDPSGGRRYEQTIIYEAGIPKNLHASVFSFFKLYWKWLKNYDEEERREIVNKIITSEERKIIGSYFPNHNEYLKLLQQARVFEGFTEKAKLTCIRLEKIFETIDNLDYIVDDDNYYNFITQINNLLGYDIRTVVRIAKLQEILIEYSKKVSFKKLDNIIRNIACEEKIILPNGSSLEAYRYNISNYMYGEHDIRGVKYEVVISSAYDINEIFNLQKKKIHRFGRNKLLYISDEYFEVEVNGYYKDARQAFFNGRIVYVYVGKVNIGDRIYIDGINITGDDGLRKRNYYIKKRWNYENKYNELGLYIKELEIVQRNNPMRTITLSFGNITAEYHTNENGFKLLSEKFIPLSDNCTEYKLIVANQQEELLSEDIVLDNIYVFSLSTHQKCKDRINKAQWYNSNDTRLIVFSKEKIKCSSQDCSQLGYSQGYYVYESSFLWEEDEIRFNDKIITIETPDSPYIILLNAEYKDDQATYKNVNECTLKIENIHLVDFILIEHDGKEYSIKADDRILEKNMLSVKKIAHDCNDLVGWWTISIYYNQKKENSVDFIITPSLSATCMQSIYGEGSKVKVQVLANSNVFYEDGRYSNKAIVSAESFAKLVTLGNLVKSNPIEFDVYDEKCKMSHSMQITPQVWGLRQVTCNGLAQINDQRVNYEILSKEPVVICSTNNGTVTIKHDSIIIWKNIVAGYKRIYIKDMLKEAKEVNTIEFCDNFGYKAKINVIYQPTLSYSGYKIGDKLEFLLNYNGPIGCKVTVKAFANNQFIDNYPLFTKHNNSIITIPIKLENLHGKELHCEYFFNSGDHRMIGERIYIDSKQKSISLSEHIILEKLLNFSSVIKNIDLSEKINFDLLIKGEE